MAHPIKRRTALAGLGALAPALSCAALARPAGADPAPADLAALESAAKREGAVTWYISLFDGQTAEAAARLFEARYPGIAVAVLRTTGQVSYQRLMSDIANKQARCDVFGSTDASHFVELKGRGALARYEPQAAAALSPAFRPLADPGYHYPTNATLYVLGHDTRAVPEAQAPARWPDLLDPRWRGQVAVAHPGYSGNTGLWVLALTKLYGWEYFERLERNKPLVGRSGFDPLTNLISGERRVGLVPLNATLLAADRGNPVAVRYPADGSVLLAGPTGIMADAPHPAAARLFLEWLLSQEFARFCVENRLDPVRTDVPPRPGAKPLSEVKLLLPSTAEAVQGIPDVIEKWRDTFGA